MIATTLAARLRGREWWIPAAVVVAMFLPALVHETFFYRDLTLLFYPKKRFLIDAIWSGQLPLWDPYTHGGQPFLGNPQNMVLHPSNLLYLILPAISAFNINIVLHLVLSAYFAWLLASRGGLTGPSSVVASAAYTLGGFGLSTINLMNWLFAWPWVPATLACLEAAEGPRRNRMVAAASLCGAMPLLSGAPELAVMLWVLAAALALRGRAKERLLLASAAAVFSAGLAAAQLVPTLDMVAQSMRSRPGAIRLSTWSVAPERLVETIVPRFFGPIGSIAPDAYWGRLRESTGFPYILSIYFGSSVIALSLFGFCASSRIGRRQELLLVSLVLAAVLLALGSNLPLSGWLHAALPPLRFFRYPVKALALASVPIALLAAAGTQRIAEDARRGRAAVLALGAATLMLAIAHAVAPSEVQRFFFAATLTAEQSRMLSVSLFHAAAAVAAIFVAALVRSRHTSWIVCGIVIVDLVAAGRSLNPLAPRQLLSEPAIAATVRTAVGQGRFYRDPDDPERIVAPRPDVAYWTWARLQTLSQYAATAYEIPTVFHIDYDGLAPGAMVRVGRVVNETPWPRRVDLLSAAGVTAFLTRATVAHPAVRRLATYRDSDGAPLHLFTIVGAASARFAGRCEGTVSAPRRTLRTVTLDVDAACPGIVRLTDVNYRGWQTTVDGKPVAANPAHEVMAAVPVPAGRHVIRRVYRPRAAVIGLAFSIASAFALLMLAIGGRSSPQPPASAS